MSSQYLASGRLFLMYFISFSKMLLCLTVLKFRPLLKNTRVNSRPHVTANGFQSFNALRNNLIFSRAEKEEIIMTCSHTLLNVTVTHV